MFNGTTIGTITCGASQQIWTLWNSSVEMGSTITGTAINQSAASINQSIWLVWNQVQVQAAMSARSYTGTTATVANIEVWPAWVAAQNGQALQRAVRDADRGITAADRRAASAVQRGEWRAIQAAEEEAKKRAEQLLVEHLSPAQREQLVQKSYFELDVISRNGERRRYQIRRGWSANVKQVDLESGRVIKTLCAHPREVVPLADNMLAQKLYLEANEEEFLQLANHS